MIWVRTRDQSGYWEVAPKLAAPNVSPALKVGLPSANASLRLCAVTAVSLREAPESEIDLLLGSEETWAPIRSMSKAPIRPSLPGKAGVGSTSTSAVVLLAPRSSQYSFWKT